MKEPPPLVLFPGLDRYLLSLDTETRASDEGQLRTLYENGLPPVASTRSLGVLFGYRPQFIGAMRRRPHRYYNVFEIRTGRKKRRIQAPRVAIKVIQKWFGYHFSRAITLPEYVVGFVPGRSAIEGASRHCQKDWIFSTDISNFFSTTSQSLVVKSLMSFGYSESGAELIADLNCLSGALAQGSPSSPVLANIAMHDVDSKLSILAQDCGASFTRYADDIVMSGMGEPPEDLRNMVESIFVPTSWQLAGHKTRLVRSAHRQKVYGLLVHRDRPRLTKGYRKRIRAIRHLLEAGKIPDSDMPRAKGHITYAEFVENYRSEGNE